MSNPQGSIFTHPLPSRATRTPPPRSKASSRGQIPAQTSADPYPRVRHFESKREQETLYLLLARPDVVDIWDQPPPVTYTDKAGRQREHTFDFLVTLRDGRRIAIAVKPYQIAQKQNFEDTLRRIRTGTPLRYADQVVLITERSYTPAAARNAQKFHDFRRTPDPEADEMIAKAIKTLVEPTTIAELIANSGLGGRAFRAAFRAIFNGLLRTLDAGDILPTTTIVTEAAS